MCYNSLELLNFRSDMVLIVSTAWLPFDVSSLARSVRGSVSVRRPAERPPATPIISTNAES